MSAEMTLRPITPADHADVLALNERNVELLAPMSQERLLELLAPATWAHVIDVGGAFAGFVLAYTTGAAYDGENFAWFSERYPELAYLDRIVLHEDFRRRGLGGRVYDEVEGATTAPVLTLEVNLDPPNDASLAFHRARGYEEVGQRESFGHTVSLMAKRLS
jgi:predicted GNAT superfamily acetyltransferase